ncbi:MAG: hypothetical protein M3463_07635 [Verrucomicrobiota bacterium]|nr:hypothetical protein [Verrucomicrobiota bacterium]
MPRETADELGGDLALAISKRNRPAQKLTGARFQRLAGDLIQTAAADPR